MKNPHRSLPGARGLRNRSSVAFTLIEIIVVLAILVILMALIMAMINKSKLQAFTAETVSNLRVLQAANLSFLAENGYYVPPKGDEGWNTMWFNRPDFTKFLSQPNANWDENFPEVATSGFRNVKHPTDENKDFGQMTIGINTCGRQHWPSDGELPNMAVLPAQVIDPSRTMAFADATDFWVQMGAADKWQNDKEWQAMAIAYRNGGERAAVAFFDGHVGFVTREEAVGNRPLWLPEAGDEDADLPPEP